MNRSKIQQWCTKIIAWVRADSKYILPDLLRSSPLYEIWFPKLMKSTPIWSNPVCWALSSRFSQSDVEIHQHSSHIKVLQTLYINFSCIKINLLILCILKESRTLWRPKKDTSGLFFIHSSGATSLHHPSGGWPVFFIYRFPLPARATVMKSDWPSKYQNLEKSSIKTKTNHCNLLTCLRFSIMIKLSCRKTQLWGVTPHHRNGFQEITSGTNLFLLAILLFSCILNPVFYEDQVLQ